MQQYSTEFGLICESLKVFIISYNDISEVFYRSNIKFHCNNCSQLSESLTLTITVESPDTPTRHPMPVP